VKRDTDNPTAPFGAVLGIAPGGVPAYSSDYDTADDRLLPDRSAFRSIVDGIYMGAKWQCVEFARRWTYVNRGWIFDDVAMAHEIFRLREIRDLRNDRMLPLRAFRNGSRRHPEPGCLLIWSAGGEFEPTGHVAVVTEVLPDRVRIAEQNVGHRPWPEGREWAREIPARITDDGGYWLRCSFDDAAILGWVVQTDDDTHAESAGAVDPQLLGLRSARVPDSGRPSGPWLNEANPDEAAYVAMMEGHRLAAGDENQTRYFVVSETARDELRRATDELHALFLHATEHVLHDDALLERFNLPRVIWPRIRQSWNNRRSQMITGRFDFALSESGLKVYEYNSDSASCHMEAGKVQGKWARHVGCDVGRDAGEGLLPALVAAWRRSGVAGVLHIMTDRDLEETYHALFMREAIDAAGISSKVLHGLAGLEWTDDGDIVDGDGVPIRWVWKTWAWETALDQLRAECNDDGGQRRIPAGDRRAGPPRLVDVLLRPEVMVFEPLWTLIPSNKAILPVVCQLFANQRYLLSSSFELRDEIRADGWVQKPIVGRSGANISLFDANHELIEETGGRFDGPLQVYQALWPLPTFDGDSAQVSTFSVAGCYAGSCVRVDPSMVISGSSDIVALRVVGDRVFLDSFPAAALGGDEVAADTS